MDVEIFFVPLLLFGYKDYSEYLQIKSVYINTNIEPDYSF